MTSTPRVPGTDWLEEAAAAVAADATAIRSLFPAAGRRVGRGPVGPDGAGGALFTWTADDAARVRLLDALGPAAAGELEGLYRHGDTAERRAVLRWIGRGGGAAAPALAIALAEDALRSNDPRLMAAALGRWTVEHLTGPSLNQAVLKCVFAGVSLAGIGGLEHRAGPELSRMLAGYVHERVAAGRDVPAELWPLIDLHPPRAELAAVTAELDHPVEARRRAAAAALAARARRG